MMNKRHLVCKKKLLRWAWFLALFHPGPVALAQTETPGHTLGLPEIIDNIEIDLGNVFQSGVSGTGNLQVDQLRTHSGNAVSLQLVGVLILGEKKLAWIKIHDNTLVELEDGQLVPGSSYRIEHIFADSVALVNVDACQQDMICTPAHILALN